MELKLEGRLALVTGGTGELGRTIVRTLATCGADVAVQYLRSHERANALVSELRGRGRRAVCLQANVADYNAVEAMRSNLAGTLGTPDVVVISAVAQCTWKSVLAQPIEDFQTQFETSVLQCVHLAKAFLPAMIAKRAGRLIAISSESAMQCYASQSAYAAGKRGMDGIVRVLAREVGQYQITVNQIGPGWTISDRVREQGTERQQDYDAGVPLRRRGTDQEVANVVAFLASDLASYITGAYLPVNGGNVMPCI